MTDVVFLVARSVWMGRDRLSDRSGWAVTDCLDQCVCVCAYGPCLSRLAGPVKFNRWCSIDVGSWTGRTVGQGVMWPVFITVVCEWMLIGRLEVSRTVSRRTTMSREGRVARAVESCFVLLSRSFVIYCCKYCKYLHKTHHSRLRNSNLTQTLYC